MISSKDFVHAKDVKLVCLVFCLDFLFCKVTDELEQPFWGVVFITDKGDLKFIYARRYRVRINSMLQTKQAIAFFPAEQTELTIRKKAAKAILQ